MTKTPSIGERQLVSFCRPRGIQPATAKKADLRFLSGADHCQIMGRTSVNYPAIGIRYFDLAGKPTAHIRTRALTESDTSGKRVAKYLQKKDTPNQLYFPPLLAWQSIAADPNAALVITEGEFKALIACQHLQSPACMAGKSAVMMTRTTHQSRCQN